MPNIGPVPDPEKNEVNPLLDEFWQKYWPGVDMNVMFNDENDDSHKSGSEYEQRMGDYLVNNMKPSGSS